MFKKKFLSKKYWLTDKIAVIDLITRGPLYTYLVVIDIMVNCTGFILFFSDLREIDKYFALILHFRILDVLRSIDNRR